MLASDVGLSTYEDGIPVDPQIGAVTRLYLSPSQVLMRVLELPVEYLDLAAATRMETPKNGSFWVGVGWERSDCLCCLWARKKKPYRNRRKHIGDGSR